MKKRPDYDVIEQEGQLETKKPLLKNILNAEDQEQSNTSERSSSTESPAAPE
ncbi:hypothetical protein [Bacillus sp. S3]|uniref:hypothetical protein n=1 Tax=Bacillus sp. S3 TaxID=486398 RepID=UPI001680C079|nr:hypothetical protein [Bacillus sp. S3]